MTDLDGRGCATQPDKLATSDLELTPKAKRGAVVDIGPAAPCLRFSSDAPGLYHAFSLPASDTPMMAIVSSVPAGHALFAPHVLLLTGAGGSAREIGFDAFHFRGSGLTALVRLHSDDRMLVVVSTPAYIGQSIDRIQEQVDHYFVPYPYIPINVGSEKDTHSVLSYTGRIEVVLAPLPKDSLDP